MPTPRKKPSERLATIIEADGTSTLHTGTEGGFVEPISVEQVHDTPTEPDRSRTLVRRTREES
jgi:hypothetical protein